MKKWLFGVLLAAAGTLSAETFVVAENGEGTLTDATVGNYNGASVGAGGTLYLDLTSAPTFAITGSGRVVKRNGATWTMTVGSPDFKGNWELIGGQVNTAIANAFGKADKNYSLTVTNGATWKITSENGGIGARVLKLGGTGVNGEGALVVDGAATFKWGGFLTTVTLLDDARVRVVKGSFVDHYNGKLNLEGHTFTICGGGTYHLYKSGISEVGEIVVEGTSAGMTILNLHSNSHTEVLTITDSEDAPITLNGYANLTLYNNVRPFARPLRVRGKGNELYHVEQYGGFNELLPDHAGWKGSITFLDGDETAALYTYLNNSSKTPGSTCCFSVSGKISGHGDLSVWVAGGSYIDIDNPLNDFTGTLKLIGGNLVLGYPGSLPSGVALTRQSGTVIFGAGEDRWRPADVVALADRSGLDVTTINYNNVTSDVAASAFVDLSSGCGALAGRKVAATAGRPIGFAGGATEESPLDLLWSAGLGVLSGTSPYYAYRINVNTSAASDFATALVIDGADVTQAPYGFIGAGVEGTSSRYSRLVITNSLVRRADMLQLDTFNTTEKSYGSCTNSLIVGKAAYGLLEIEAGAVISNRLLVGMHGGQVYTDTSYGGVRQRGGKMVSVSADTSYNKSGSVGSGQECGGYYELQGGELVSHGIFSLGMAGVGTMLVNGGSYCSTNYLGSATAGEFYMGAFNGGKAALRVSRGTVDCLGADGRSVWVGHGNTGRLLCSVTVDGPDALCDFHGGELYLGWGCGNGFYYFNFNDGVFRAKSIQKHSSNNRHLTNLYVVSFNGGTFKAGAAGWMFNYQAPYAPNDLVVYERGATVDTDGFDCGIATPIRAAYGKGIKSIALGEPITHVMSPLVEIISTNALGEAVGCGATAFAHYNWETHTIDRLDMTSAGSGYETNDLLAVRLLVRRNTSTRTLGMSAVELVDNVSTGSFTKAGAGVLSLAATNTWGGATILAGGVLKCLCDCAIPTNTTVVLAGGVLNMNGRKMENGDAAPKKWRVDVATAEAKGGVIPYEGTLTFIDGATLEILNAAARGEDAQDVVLVETTGGIVGNPEIVGELDPEWHVVFTGTKIKYARRRGTMLIVR